MAETKSKGGCIGRIVRGMVALVLVAVIVGVAVAMLGGDEGGTPGQCTAAPAEIVADITNGIGTIPTGLDEGVTIDNAYIVRADDRENTWYVGARMHGGALDDDTYVGVWATSRIDENGAYTGEGAILSVGGFAEEFSDWPDGDLAGDSDDLSITDDAARQAEDCASTD